ncbi:MAG: hypothetical protein ACKOAX_07265 [Candidatus Kapaibacterium sp.]
MLQQPVDIRMHSSSEPISNSRLSVTRHPHTYFKELAEMGALYDFLLQYMEEDFRSNPDFHREMLRLMIDNKDVCARGVEEEYLNHLGHALEKFMEKLYHATTARI